MLSTVLSVILAIIGVILCIVVLLQSNQCGRSRRCKRFQTQAIHTGVKTKAVLWKVLLRE